MAFRRSAARRRIVRSPASGPPTCRRHWCCPRPFGARPNTSRTTRPRNARLRSIRARRAGPLRSAPEDAFVSLSSGHIFMNTVFRAALPALSMLCVTLPAHAQDQTDDGQIVVANELLHPAAGLMNEHMHDGGEVMVGVRWQRVHSSGPNVSGTDEISDAEIHAAGYTARTASMDMDMVMLDLMYAPTDDVTLMVMPHYMW